MQYELNQTVGSFRVTAVRQSEELRAEAELNMPKDTVRFLRKHNGVWEPLGPAHPMRFTLDHFCGARFGLFHYAEKEAGGTAAFSRFKYLDAGEFGA